MAARKPNKTKVKPTTMRLSADLLKAATKKATKQGVSRSMYFQQLLRKDLGMDVLAADETSVFG